MKVNLQGLKFLGKIVVGLCFTLYGHVALSQQMVTGNGETEKSINIDLSFLGEGDYNALMVHDKKPEMAMVSLVRSRKTFGGQKGVNLIKTTASQRESLLIQLIPGGGFVALFSK